MAALNATDPVWVRKLYLDHMEVVFSHSWMGCNPEGMLKMLQALERLPEGKTWLMRVSPSVEKIMRGLKVGEEADLPNPTLQQLTNIFQRLEIEQEPLTKEERP